MLCKWPTVLSACVNGHLVLNKQIFQWEKTFFALMVNIIFLLVFFVN